MQAPADYDETWRNRYSGGESFEEYKQRRSAEYTAALAQRTGRATSAPSEPEATAGSASDPMLIESSDEEAACEAEERQEPEVLDDLAVGDRVLRKGQEAEVVKIDRALHPPAYSLRKLSDGEEVGSERQHLTKLQPRAETEASQSASACAASASAELSHSASASAASAESERPSNPEVTPEPVPQSAAAADSAGNAWSSWTGSCQARSAAPAAPTSSPWSGYTRSVQAASAAPAAPTSSPWSSYKGTSQAATAAPANNIWSGYRPSSCPAAAATVTQKPPRFDAFTGEWVCTRHRYKVDATDTRERMLQWACTRKSDGKPFHFHYSEAESIVIWGKNRKFWTRGVVNGEVEWYDFDGRDKPTYVWRRPREEERKPTPEDPFAAMCSDAAAISARVQNKLCPASKAMLSKALSASAGASSSAAAATTRSPPPAAAAGAAAAAAPAMPREAANQMVVRADPLEAYKDESLILAMQEALALKEEPHPSTSSVPKEDETIHPASSSEPKGESWTEFVDPSSRSRWLCNDEDANEFFFIDMALQAGWQQFADESGTKWYWHEASSRHFYPRQASESAAESQLPDAQLTSPPSSSRLPASSQQQHDQKQQDEEDGDWCAWIEAERELAAQQKLSAETTSSSVTEHFYIGEDAEETPETPHLGWSAMTPGASDTSAAPKANPYTAFQ